MKETERTRLMPRAIMCKLVFDDDKRSASCHDCEIYDSVGLNALLLAFLSDLWWCIYMLLLLSS